MRAGGLTTRPAGHRKKVVADRTASSQPSRRSDPLQVTIDRGDQQIFDLRIVAQRKEQRCDLLRWFGPGLTGFVHGCASIRERMIVGLHPGRSRSLRDSMKMGRRRPE
jgi:hypothetical protein